MPRTALLLFDKIAQDNDVLKIFEQHSVRVMYLSTMLGNEVGCYDDDLKIASLLHDIGKIGLSSEILLKPGKLNSLEKTIVETHSHIGNNIVRKELGKTRAAQFIRDHHENWDGTGYPRRLTGEEISIQGRIIRICDSFDTMTYDLRSYNHKRMPHDDALNELKSCSWKQYDGNLVESFISLMKKIKLPEVWYDSYNSDFMDNIFNSFKNPHDYL